MFAEKEKSMTILVDLDYQEKEKERKEERKCELLQAKKDWRFNQIEVIVINSDED